MKGKFPAVLLSDSLNGKNGFKIIGEKNSFSGYSVGAAGDINGDGYADLLIGAPYYPGGADRSYVIFGGAQVGNEGLIDLSTLNGINGFKLVGEVNGDRSGYSVSTAGDINGDGYSDLLIGAPWYVTPNVTGRSYVVFGDAEVGRQGLISLSSLNGTNGFKLNGEGSSDQSGTSVSTVGDINRDGYTDLLIGAYGHASSTGRSYVVFGGLKIDSQGLIALSALNGTNGFKLDGEAANDYSGFVVSMAGDVNGDGYSDLLVVSPHAASGNGRSYILFGGAAVGSQSIIALAALNGTNGFKLDGEPQTSVGGNGQGYVVSAAGDVNGDGYADLLVGASCYPFASNHCGSGRSYVVFGGEEVGSQGLISLSSLNGTNGFKLDGEAQADASGYSVSSAGDFNGDGYADVLIGALRCSSTPGCSYMVFGGPGIIPQGLLSLSALNGANGFKLDSAAMDGGGYSMSTIGDINGDGVADTLIGVPGYNSSAGGGYVVFGDIPPVLAKNSLNLQTNDRVQLNSTFLFAYDQNHQNNTLIFFASNVTHGYFESIDQPGVSITNFTQPQLSNGAIWFIHDGSPMAPGYDITVRSEGIALVGPATAKITYLQVPAIINNSLIIHQGQTVVMSTNSLSVVDTHPANQVIFNVNNVQHGEFQLFPGNTTVLQFTEQALVSGQVLFVQDGSSNAPAYRIAATDPDYTLLNYLPAGITFYRRPVITTNPFMVHQGETVKLTDADIGVVDDYLPSQVTFTVSQVKHGQFQLSLGNVSISQFTEQQLLAGQIAFRQDNSVNVPSYQIEVSDPYFTLPPTISEGVEFYPQPVFVHNQLTLFEGEARVLTLANINVSDSYSDTQILFTVNDCQHGRFELIPAGNSSTIQFTQQQIKTGQIRFVHDNQPYPPAYNLTVTDGYFTLRPVSGDIYFTLVNKPPFLNNTMSSQVFAAGQDFNFRISPYIFYDEQGKSLQLSAGLAGGFPLPGAIIFNPSTATFSGLVNEPENYNVSVTAMSVAGLKTSTYFQLQIVGSAPQSTSLFDVKTIASVVVSLGGAAISILSYIYAKYRFYKSRERQNPFANAIHQRLRLGYPDFSDKDGKRYADTVNQMVALIKTKSKVDIDELGLSTEPQEQQMYHCYADLFAAEIQRKVKITRVYCGTSQELHLKNLEKRVEAIADAVSEQALKPQGKLSQSSWCAFFCCRRDALIIEKSVDLELSGSPSPRGEGMPESKSGRQNPTTPSIFAEPKIPEQEPGAEGEGEGEVLQPGEGASPLQL
ncbi:MAG: FG-GAP repeat protein [Proteobacteria bacterium]|nr:FG-GAP repeat protein [Pseudomonadota bacterium]